MNRFRPLAFTGLLVATLALVSACESTQESSSTMPSTKPATTMPTTAEMGVLNDSCPISGRPVDPDAPHASFAGHQIGFCCGGCVGRWDAMSESDRHAFVSRLRQ
jgi:hypothetical protein